MSPRAAAPPASAAVLLAGTTIASLRDSAADPRPNHLLPLPLPL